MPGRGGVEPDSLTSSRGGSNRETDHRNDSGNDRVRVSRTRSVARTAANARGGEEGGLSREELPVLSYRSAPEERDVQAGYGLERSRQVPAGGHVEEGPEETRRAGLEGVHGELARTIPRGSAPVGGR